MLPAALQDVIDAFQSVDPQTRLELLLDYSRKLPPLPADLQQQRDAGANQVHECMTPVFLWVLREGETSGAPVCIHADVAEEAPTVKGYISILVQGLHGASADEIATLPADLLDEFKLHSVIRMNRVMGLAAVVARIKREAAKLA